MGSMAASSQHIMQLEAVKHLTNLMSEVASPQAAIQVLSDSVWLGGIRSALEHHLESHTGMLCMFLVIEAI